MSRSPSFHRPRSSRSYPSKAKDETKTEVGVKKRIVILARKRKPESLELTEALLSSRSGDVDVVVSGIVKNPIDLSVRPTSSTRDGFERVDLSRKKRISFKPSEGESNRYLNIPRKVPKQSRNQLQWLQSLKRNETTNEWKSVAASTSSPRTRETPNRRRASPGQK